MGFLNALQNFTNKASQFVGNLDQDKSMGGFQLQKGGLINNYLGINPQKVQQAQQQISPQQFSQATVGMTPKAKTLLQQTPIRYAIPTTMDYLPTPMRNTGSLINPNTQGGNYNPFTRSINMSPGVPQELIPEMVRHESLHGADYNTNLASSNRFDTLPALDTMMAGRALGDSYGFRNKMSELAKLRIAGAPNTYDQEDEWMQDKEGFAYTGQNPLLSKKYAPDYKNIFEEGFAKILFQGKRR